MHMYMYITKSSIRCLERQGKATQPKLAQSGHFPKKNWLLQVRFKPTTLVMLLPTELPRQLSWLGKNHTYTSTHDHHIGVSCTTHLPSRPPPPHVKSPLTSGTPLTGPGCLSDWPQGLPEGTGSQAGPL